MRHWEVRRVELRQHGGVGLVQELQKFCTAVEEKVENMESQAGGWIDMFESVGKFSSEGFCFLRGMWRKAIR